MGDLDQSWAEVFSSIGWKPSDAHIRKTGIEATILGELVVGDNPGEIIGVTFSSVKTSKRNETTILGFTVGGDNGISEREIIYPENRINGYIQITERSIIIVGTEIRIIPFGNVILATGSTNTITASNYELQKLGGKNYQYTGDIYLAKFKMNKQNNLDYGYDEYTLAINIGTRRPSKYEDTWKKVWRIISI
jgi:hypothetical protein